MSKSRPKPAVPELSQRRGGTFAVGVSAIVAAWVLTACDPVSVEPLLTAIIPSASAEPLTASHASPEASRSRAATSMPIFGEVSTIEPIRRSSETGAGDRAVGYRIHIRLDGGGTRSVEREHLNGLDVGVRVRVDGSRLKQV